MGDYNIDRLLKECMNLNLIELRIFLQKEHINPVRISRKSPQWEYNDFINEFLVLLEQGIRPGGMSRSDFMRTKPVVQNLVDKGHFHQSLLEIYV